MYVYLDHKGDEDIASAALSTLSGIRRSKRGITTIKCNPSKNTIQSSFLIQIKKIGLFFFNSVYHLYKINKNEKIVAVDRRAISSSSVTHYFG